MNRRVTETSPTSTPHVAERRTWSPRVWLLALAYAALAAAPTFGQLEWRISVKWIRDLSGNRAPLTNYTIAGAVAEANRILDGYGRGYRIRVIEEVDIYEANLPAPPEIWFCGSGTNAVECDQSEPNAQLVQHWFDAPFIVAVRRELDNAAEADYAGLDRFHWRSDAINVYMLHTDRGGLSVQPPYGSGMLLGIGGGITTPLHEIGHFMWLCHTFGCSDEGPENGCAAVDPNSGPLDDPLYDRVVDTLPDDSDWGRRQIAWYSFCAPYSSLPASDKQRVDNVYRNVMSYHPSSADRVRFTSDQLDRMTDASNGMRINITDGLTHFVDGSSGGSQDGSSADPWPSFTIGLLGALASPTTDIVLVRAGAYDESPIINFPVFLRASRGNAVIGTSSP